MWKFVSLNVEKADDRLYVSSQKKGAPVRNSWKLLESWPNCGVASITIMMFTLHVIESWHILCLQCQREVVMVHNYLPVLSVVKYHQFF